MNLLAHAWLSGRTDADVVGNFIADFVKGDPAHPRHGLPPGIVAGIQLHRAIDAFTDGHADVAAARALLRSRCGKYAGVAVDVLFDHLLAGRFAELTGEPLAPFVHYVYDVLTRHYGWLPTGAARMATAMIRHDWLTHYQTRAGIGRALTGLSQRTAYASGLERAAEVLDTHYVPLQLQFDRFWPELTAFVAHYVALRPTTL